MTAVIGIITGADTEEQSKVVRKQIGHCLYDKKSRVEYLHNKVTGGIMAERKSFRSTASEHRDLKQIATDSQQKNHPTPIHLNSGY